MTSHISVSSQLPKPTVNIRPLPLFKAAGIFLLAGLGFRLSLYNGLPLLIKQGATPFEAFIVTFTVPAAILFALAFAAVKQEGGTINAAALSNRFRLHALKRRDIKPLLIALLAAFISAPVLTPARDWMLNLLPPLPNSFPIPLNPIIQNQNLTEAVATWMGPDAVGNWGWALLILLLLFFNILGEELLWRGVLLPRQELVHGRYTWIIHGLLWNLFHLPFYPWYLVYGLQFTLPLSYAAHKTGNTCASILLHTIANVYIFILMIGIIASGM